MGTVEFYKAQQRDDRVRDQLIDNALTSTPIIETPPQPLTRSAWLAGMFAYSTDTLSTEYADLGEQDGMADVDFAVSGNRRFMREFTLTADCNVTITPSGVPSDTPIELYVLIRQDAIGSHTITASSTTIPDIPNIKAQLNQGANTTTTYRLTTTDGGTTWSAEHLGVDAAIGSIGDLNDVTISTPGDDQILLYDADDSVWKNASLMEVTSSVSNLDDLGDVNADPDDLTGGEVLRFKNGSNTWEGEQFSLGDLSDVSFLPKKLKQGMVLVKVSSGWSATRPYDDSDVLSYLGALAASGWTGLANFGSAVQNTVQSFTKAAWKAISAFSNAVTEIINGVYTYLADGLQGIMNNLGNWLYGYDPDAAYNSTTNPKYHGTDFSTDPNNTDNPISIWNLGLAFWNTIGNILAGNTDNTASDYFDEGNNFGVEDIGTIIWNQLTSLYKWLTATVQEGMNNIGNFLGGYDGDAAYNASTNPKYYGTNTTTQDKTISNPFQLEDVPDVIGSAIWSWITGTYAWLADGAQSIFNYIGNILGGYDSDAAYDATTNPKYYGTNSNTENPLDLEEFGDIIWQRIQGIASWISNTAQGVMNALGNFLAGYNDGGAYNATTNPKYHGTVDNNNDSGNPFQVADLWSVITTGVSNFFSTIWTNISGITNFFSNLWTSLTTNVAAVTTYIGTQALSVVNTTYSWLADRVTGILYWVWDWVFATDYGTQYAAAQTDPSITFTPPTAVDLVGNIWNGIVAVFTGLGNSIWTVLNNIVDFAERLWGGITGDADWSFNLNEAGVDNSNEIYEKMQVEITDENNPIENASDWLDAVPKAINSATRTPLTITQTVSDSGRGIIDMDGNDIYGVDRLFFNSVDGINPNHPYPHIAGQGIITDGVAEISMSFMTPLNENFRWSTAIAPSVPGGPNKTTLLMVLDKITLSVLTNITSYGRIELRSYGAPTLLNGDMTLNDNGDVIIRSGNKDVNLTNISSGTPDPAPPANNAPVITDIPDATVTAGNTFTYNVIATDADGDTLSYSLTDRPSSATINSSGVITWIPTEGNVGAHDFEVSVSDGTDSTTTNFTVNVSSAITSTKRIPIKYGSNWNTTSSTVLDNAFGAERGSIGVFALNTSSLSGDQSDSLALYVKTNLRWFKIRPRGAADSRGTFNPFSSPSNGNPNNVRVLHTIRSSDGTSLNAIGESNYADGLVVVNQKDEVNDEDDGSLSVLYQQTSTTYQIYELLDFGDDATDIAHSNDVTTENQTQLIIPTVNYGSNTTTITAQMLDTDFGSSDGFVGWYNAGSDRLCIRVDAYWYEWG